MTVSANAVTSGIPVSNEPYTTVHGGTTALIINPGDYVCFSGSAGIATEDALASWKASGVGIAMDRNPALDPAGRQVVNSALLVARVGHFRVSANFSGQPNLGVITFPATTGSAVNASTGLTGLGATWGTATPQAVSGGTAATPYVKGVAQVEGWYDSGPGGTGQLDIWLWDRNADIY